MKIQLYDAKKVIRVTPSPPVSLDNFDNYQELREKAKDDFANFLRLEKRRMSTIVTRGDISRTAWARKYKIVNVKVKRGVYYPDGKEHKIIAGFKKLYASTVRVHSLDMDTLKQVITIKGENCGQVVSFPALWRPRSHAQDIMVFHSSGIST